MNMNDIKVSIICNAYNHEKYIRDAFEGFLAQQVNFKYEIVVHDDASTDNTAKIIREYEEKYPDLVNAVYQQENQYSKRDFYQFRYNIYRRCRGQYVAFCEGDDFWIDRHKLQIQVDFLEEYPEYILTAHNAVSLGCSDGLVKVINPYDCDKMITPEEIIMRYNGNVPTASMVMRADVLKMDRLFLESDVGDWTLQLSSITKGKVYYFDRIMSVYRSFHEGSWSATWAGNLRRRFEHSLNMAGFLKKYNEYTEGVYEKYIITQIQRYINTALDIIKKEGKRNIQYNGNKEFDQKELERVFEQTFNECYYDQGLREFILKHKYNVIFGAGDYASRLKKQLNYHKVIFEGFVTSEWGKEGGEYLGKPVWHLSNIPFDKKELGVIVAISPTIWSQLMETLERYDITEYICPFLYNA